jgi:antitoxin (DNA-binding transcriptional repressor) of toxin-antitoxin stability system
MKSITIVTAAEAKARLPQLLQLVTAGEAVLIVNKRTRQTFTITPYQNNEAPRKIQNQPGS